MVGGTRPRRVITIGPTLPGQPARVDSPPPTKVRIAPGVRGTTPLLAAVDITVVFEGPVRGRHARETLLSLFSRLSPLRRSRRGCPRCRLDIDEFPDQEALMGEVGAIFKRCGCRNLVNGRRLDRSCP